MFLLLWGKLCNVFWEKKKMVSLGDAKESSLSLVAVGKRASDTLMLPSLAKKNCEKSKSISLLFHLNGTLASASPKEEQNSFLCF